MKKAILVLMTGLLIISVNLYAQDGGAGAGSPEHLPEHTGSDKVDLLQTDPAAANSPDTAVSDKTRSSKDHPASDNNTDNNLEIKTAAEDTSLQSSSLAALSTGGSGTGAVGDSVSVQALLDIKGVQVSPAGNSGAATTGIPIMVPPGRKGIEPRLSLNYNSNSSNGWLGIGWNLDMGAIQRSTKRGVDYSANDYVVTENGSTSELTPRGDWGGNYYGAKIEGSFSKYYKISDSSGWIVTTKVGTKYYYGTTSASRQDSNDPVTGQYRVFKWCLDRVEDANGNYMTISYLKYAGEIYLSRIDYTGNKAGVAPTNYILFYDEYREDDPWIFTTNAEVWTAYRLRSIIVYGDGFFTREYDLSYRYNNNLSRSLLTSVVLYGYGSDGYTQLTSYDFEYNEKVNESEPDAQWGDRTKGYIANSGGYKMADVNGDGLSDLIYDAADGNVRVLISAGTGSMVDVKWGKRTIGYSTNGGGFQMTDVNGDGLADFIYDATDGVVRVLISTGTSFKTDVKWGKRATGYNSGSPGFRMADVDGDGLADFIYDASDGYVRVLISAGASFKTDARWGKRTKGYSTVSGGFRMADVSGDGKADLIYDASDGYVRVLISAGASSRTDAPWGNRSSSIYIQYGSFQMADVNRDALADFIYTNGVDVHVMISTGSGFMYDTLWGNLSAGFNFHADSKSFQTTDVNGDGLADFVYHSADNYVHVLLSAGTKFMTDVQWGAFTTSYSTNSLGFRMADVDGDGLADFIYDATDSYVHALRGKAPYPDTLSSISNGIGGVTTLEYLPSSMYDNCMDIGGKNVCLPFIVQTLSSTTVSDGHGNSSITNYTYSGGYFDSVDREYRGFEYIKATGCLSYQNNICTPDPKVATAETWFYQDDIYKGLPDEQVTKDSSGNIYASTANTYDYVSPYTGVYFPRLIQKDDYVYDGTATAKQARTSFTYDSYGNITRKYFWGDTSITGDERDEYTEYVYSATNWLMSFPSHTYINDSSGTTKAQTWFTYDTKGNLLTKTGWLNGGTNPVITYTYDPYGNVKTITDAKQTPPTIIYYDHTNTYPDTIENSLHHFVSMNYDYRFGKVLDRTDPNGRKTVYEYDKFGRIKKVTTPAPYGITEYFYQNYGDPYNQNIREELKDGSGTLLHWKETYFDGLGRIWREKSGGPGAGIIIMDTEYNNKGLVKNKSLPYYEGDSVYKTTYTYDPVDRLIYALNPDTTSSTTNYMKGRTTHIDANNHRKIAERDVYDRIIRVEEYTGNSTSTYSLYAATTYKYDVLGNLKNVTDVNNNQTNIAYDTLSRKTSMTDPDMGNWTYQYDANGNLTYQKDAKNQIITFTYDALNRITKKDYQDPAYTDVIYSYDWDSSTNTIGRLRNVTDGSGSAKFEYDSMGQITKSVKTISSITYTTQTQYDAIGRVKKIIYPDNVGVDYTYNGNGIIKDIRSGTQTYAAYNSYNAAGSPLLATYGNGVTTQYQYYTENNRLFSITTSKQGTGFMNLAYSYDSLGNITRIQDYLDSTKTRDYTYDDLDRLIRAASVSYGGTLSWQYDKIGNMTYNSRYGNYYYEDPAHRHAVTRAGSDTYTYDANGNMISRAGKTLTYDYDKMPTRITYGSTYVDSVYDANGQRIKKITPSSTTVYIGNHYECTSGVCTKYIMSGTQIIAQINTSGAYYYHTDHLGSSSIITDSTGNKTEDIYYYPYGEIKTNTGSVNVRYKYTGKEFDAEDGLYYYGARYYDPKLTRFISSDTIVPQPFYPQSLNRYAYAYNNPIVLRDLDGHYAPDPGFDMDLDWSWVDDLGGGSGGGSDYDWSDWGSGSSVGGSYYYNEYDYSLSSIHYNDPVSSPRVLTFSNSYANDEIGDYRMYAQASAYDVQPTTNYDEINLLAQITFAEGAGDYKSENAMEGISWVVRNRMEIGSKYDFPDRSSYAAIIYQSGQFEAVGGDLWNKAANPASLTGPNATAYDRALTVAGGVYNGTIHDPTKGAVFFTKDQNTNFFKNATGINGALKYEDKFGSHYFYRYK